MSICYVNGSYEEKNSAMISIQDRDLTFLTVFMRLCLFLETKLSILINM